MEDLNIQELGKMWPNIKKKLLEIAKYLVPYELCMQYLENYSYSYRQGF